MAQYTSQRASYVNAASARCPNHLSLFLSSPSLFSDSLPFWVLLSSRVNSRLGDEVTCPWLRGQCTGFNPPAQASRWESSGQTDSRRPLQGITPYEFRSFDSWAMHENVLYLHSQGRFGFCPPQKQAVIWALCHWNLGEDSLKYRFTERVGCSAELENPGS